MFLPDVVHAETIRDQARYGGTRVTMQARLIKTRIHVQVDICFGDVVTPGPEETSFPVLLDFPAPQLRAYPIYTVAAEKIEAMASIGAVNTRMKDFYDIWFMSQMFDFDGYLLTTAIRNTFERRKTPLSTELPLTKEFSSLKSTQWNAFISRNSLAAPDLDNIVTVIKLFVEPPFLAARKGENLPQQWKAATDWRVS